MKKKPKYKCWGLHHRKNKEIIKINFKNPKIGY
jgi:hypothetical protein